MYSENFELYLLYGKSRAIWEFKVPKEFGLKITLYLYALTLYIKCS